MMEVSPALTIGIAVILLTILILFYSELRGWLVWNLGHKKREGPPIQHSPLQHKTEAALLSAGELMGLSRLSQVTQSHSVSSEPP